ncbi:MAG: hypothetical protein Q4G27_01100 [Flavobacteriaceae bacterium]|nr:hypothetical protein [Flavobacteriaceae bacterium]
MIKEVREKFNKEYSDNKQKEIFDYFHSFPIYKTGFRIAESPIFLDKAFGKKVLEASESIIDQILHGNIVREDSIPKNLDVPGHSNHFHFLAIDFGICENENGEIEPQLIEIQAFPSLFFYQKHLAEQFLKHYNIPDNFSILPHKKFDGNTYTQHLKKLIIKDYNPQNVVLLDLYTREQKTGIDFALTKEELGIKPVCITEVYKENNDLYYIREGVETPIYRIYNRLIFDELLSHKNLKLNFDITDDVHISWVTHPDWFFKISKIILPLLKHNYVPASYFVNEFPSSEKLEDYVLKPLFSFAGKGVIIHPTQNDVQQLKNPENFILQKKKNYAPIFEDLNGEKAKAELRMLYTWMPGEKRPQAQINLVRMTKSDKVNVDHLGLEKIWTGSSIAFFELDA